MFSIKKLFFLLAFLPALAFALEPSDIKVNQVYKSTGMLNIRNSPPKTIFYIMGDKIGLLKPDEKIVVKAIEEKKTVLANHIWLRVEKVGTKESGWIYGGEAGKASILEEIR